MTHNNKASKRAVCLLVTLILTGGSLAGCGKQAENAVSGNMKQEISASDEEETKDGKKVSGTESDDKDSGKASVDSSNNKTSKGNSNQEKDKETKAGTEDKKKTDEKNVQADKKETSSDVGADKDSSGNKKPASGSAGGNTGSMANGTAQASDKSGQSASAGNGTVKPAGSGQTVKPQAGSSASQASSGGNAAGSSSGNGAASSGSGQVAHSHSWKQQTKTVHHDAETRQEYVVDKPAWDEDIYQDQPVYQSVEKVICNGCGAEFADYPSFEAHSDAYIDQDDFGHGSWSIDWDQVLVGWTSVKVDTVHHDAVGHMETVVVKAAYDETVDQGYVCAGCGAIRS